MRRLILILVLTTLSLFGASFDCTKAKSDVEKAICQDDELSKLDEKLSIIFKEALQSTEDKKQFKKEQLSWMKERNQCKSKKCIKQKYEEKLVLFENDQYIKQVKIDTNASLYYVDYHVLILDLQSGKYQNNKECAQCQKDGNKGDRK